MTSSDSNPPPVLRRSFTLPSRFASRPPSRNRPTSSSSYRSFSSDSNNDAVETLYTHPSARIVSFSSSSSSRPVSYPSRNDDIQKAEATGTLPWASLTERTMATGPLQFYKVPGSAGSKVAFLNSGSVLQPILSKSQCWCVDGETKFVLRIRENAYYRIELPNACQEDREKAEELKQVLPKMLLYELTPCPFKRGFTVDLPEQKPIRYRPWRPAEREKAAENFKHGEGSSEEYVTAPSDGDSDKTSGSEETPRRPVTSSGISPREIPPHVSVPERARRFSSPFRPTSFPLPGVDIARIYRLDGSPFRRADVSTRIYGSTESHRSPQRHVSCSTQSESLHSISINNTLSTLPPSPPYSDDALTIEDIELPRRRHHVREVSEMTVIPDCPTTEDEKTTAPTTVLSIPKDFEDSNDQQPDPPVTSTIVPSLTEFSITSTSPATQLRNRRSHRVRDLSPLPNPVNLIPSPRDSTPTQPFLLDTFLDKALSFLGPPLRVLSVMLKIASKVAQGALHGVVVGFNEHGDRIPYRWGECEENEWELNDYDMNESDTEDASHAKEQHDSHITETCDASEID